MPSSSWNFRIRSPITRDIVAGDSSFAAGNSHSPVFVELADDARARRLVPVIQLLLQLILDQRPLFLDDNDLFQPAGELPRAVLLERPDHADLVEPDADPGGLVVVDAQILQRLPDIEIGLAAGRDAEARPGAVDYYPVDPVGPGEGERGIGFVAAAACLPARGYRPASGCSARPAAG